MGWDGERGGRLVMGVWELGWARGEGFFLAESLGWVGGKEGDGRKGKQGYRETGRSGDREEVAKKGDFRYRNWWEGDVQIHSGVDQG